MFRLMKRLLRLILRYTGLLICMAVIVLWVLSFGRSDEWYISRQTAKSLHWGLSLESAAGGMRLSYRRDDRSGAADIWITHSSTNGLHVYPLAEGRGKLTWIGISWDVRRGPRESRRSLSIPHWLVFIPLGLWQLAWVRRGMRERRGRRRRAAGRCAECGYDMRGSPDRCPECGNVPDAKFSIDGDTGQKVGDESGIGRKLTSQPGSQRDAEPGAADY
jgi:hypothetical protein